MIVIDGQKSELALTSFSNLEEVFCSVMENGLLEDKIVTDVFINEEPFTEIYPHQSEDIEVDGIQSLEIKTVPVGEMAVSITRELYKVVRILSEGAKQVAELFRRADDAEALELYQDLLDVNRNFLNMISVLRDEFALADNQDFIDSVEELVNLFTEMTEVQENEDWILLADLLEYEFLPAIERWKKVIAGLRENIRENDKE